MSVQTLQLIQEVISHWYNKRQFTYEEKQVFDYPNPIGAGGVALRFKNNVRSFFCKKELIPLEFESKQFFINSLQKDAFSIEAKQDRERLKKFLEEFDEEFYEFVQRKVEECPEQRETSDPLFFN